MTLHSTDCQCSKCTHRRSLFQACKDLVPLLGSTVISTPPAEIGETPRIKPTWGKSTDVDVSRFSVCCEWDNDKGQRRIAEFKKRTDPLYYEQYAGHHPVCSCPTCSRRRDSFDALMQGQLRKRDEPTSATGKTTPRRDDELMKALSIAVRANDWETCRAISGQLLDLYHQLCLTNLDIKP